MSSSSSASSLGEDSRRLSGQHGSDISSPLTDLSREDLTKPGLRGASGLSPQNLGDALEPIAIIGFSQNLPGGANTPEKFWDLIINARSGLTDIPSDRWNINGFYRDQTYKQGVIKARKAHFVEQDVSVFDAPFFNITAAEASFMDPQQRWLLETTYHAFENAGLRLDDVSSSRTAVFVAAFLQDYARLLEKDATRRPTSAATGNGNAILANRLSWYFNLKGPSIALDTACSGGLTSLHLACQSIRGGESDMAVIGAANLMISPETFIALSDSGFLSKDGKSYSFDHRAEGYSRGEGSGVVVLKRLSDAIRDGNTVRAVVRGSGVNQDGRTLGITLPDAGAQKTLIQETYRSAGLSMSSTRYVEAHGTGTRVGDPIEARAIAEAFAGNIDADRPLYVGSLKPNIGHLENASGVASLIKAVLVLENGIVPPCALMERVSDRVDEYSGSSLTFPTTAALWPSAGLRRVSVNSFGYGGANSHVILDDAFNYARKRSLAVRHRTQEGLVRRRRHHTSEPSPAILDFPRLLSFSSADKNGIQRISSAYEELLQVKKKQSGVDAQFLADLSFTLSERRSRLPWRSTMMVPSSESSFDLETFNGQLTSPQEAAKLFKALFVFTGQGAQWPQMGRDLLSYRVFRDSMEASESCLKVLGCRWSLSEELRRGTGEKDGSRINEPEVSQVACTAVQIALVDLLRHWCVEPEVVVGHSSGEIAAAYCTRSLSRRSALKLAYGRGLASAVAGRLQEERLGMMAVNVGKDEAQSLIDNTVGLSAGCSDVSIACINSPKQVVLSGAYSTLEFLRTKCEEHGIIARFLKVGMAYHSPYMESVAAVYEALVQNLEPDEDGGFKRATMYSSMKAARVSSEELIDPGFWVRNLISPVQFSEALSQALNGTGASNQRKLGAQKGLGINFVLEVGPHPALRGAVREILQLGRNGSKLSYSPTLQRNMKDTEALLLAAGTLYTHGSTIDLLAANRLDEIRESLNLLTDLPSYPFNHAKQFWNEGRSSKAYNQRLYPPHDLLGVREPSSSSHEPRWRHVINLDEQMWIKDHQVFGITIYPASGLLVMALEAAKQLVETDKPVSSFLLQNVIISKALIVRPNSLGTEAEISLKLLSTTKGQNPSWYSFRICAFEGQDSYECCHGEVGIEYEQQKVSEVDGATHQQILFQRRKDTLEESRETLHGRLSADEFYSRVKECGLDFGPTFQGLSDIRTSKNGEALTTASIDALYWRDHLTGTEMSPHIIHPTVLDSILQHTNAAITHGFEDNEAISGVPSRIRSLRVSSKPCSDLIDAKLSIHTSAVKVGHRTATLNHFAIQETEQTLVVDGVVDYAYVEDQSSATQEIIGRCYHLDWKPDISLMSASEITEYCVPVFRVEHESRRDFHSIQDLRRQVIHYTLRDVQKTPTRYKNGKAYLKNYIAFMRRKMDEFDGEFEPCEDLGQYLDDMTRHVCGRPEGELVMRIARNLTAFLDGSVDPLDVMFEDDLMARAYGEAATENHIRNAITNYLDLLCHKNPQLRILEIGAGTGSITGIAVDVLGRNGDDKENGPRFSHYCYTDISPSFFEGARHRFAAYTDRMEFKLFDIEKDSASQGFRDGDFDVIIAGAVLHVASDLSLAIKNVGRLLKPNGKLVMVDLTTPDSLRTSFTYGLLPGWWLSSEEERKTGPLLSPSQWCVKLEENGFKGPDLYVPSDPVEEYQAAGLFISSKKVDELTSCHDDTEICVLSSQTSTLQLELVEKIDRFAAIHGLKSCRKVNVDGEKWPDMSGNFCIFLPDLEGNAWLRKLTPASLDMLKGLLSTATGILWMTGTDGTVDDAFQGLPFGLSRAYRSENPSFKFVTLAVDTVQGLDSIYDKLSKILLSSIRPLSEEGSEDEFRDVDKLLHIGRLVQARAVDRQIYSHSIRKAEEKPFRDGSGRKTAMVIETPGLLHTLQFDDVPFALESTPLGESEIEVEIGAVGVNFKDLMIAYGQIDLPSFGSECVGIIRKKGSHVTNVNVDDRVACLMDGAFGNTSRCPASTAIKLPSTMPDEVGASLPFNMCITVYAFLHVGRLTAGESVLIHSGAGDLGQTAIQMAKYLGATVYTTVGTKEKRDFLHQHYDIPLNHILDSGSFSFTTTLQRLTNGRGVDVVLNSLGGQVLRETWKCMAPFGRFLEVGQKDTLTFGNLPMDMFAQNVTFSTVNLAVIYSERPDLAGTLLKQAIDLVEAGLLSPPSPLHVFSGSEVEKAFRLTEEGESIGKVVVKFDDKNLVSALPSKIPAWYFSENASYLIVGGFGGLGKGIARWMVKRGAKNLILLSRRTDYDENDMQFLASLKAEGASILTPSCDVADETSLKKALENCMQEMPPIKGCIQASMVIRDVDFQDITCKDIQTSIRPKVDGSLNLHQNLPEDLDFFVILASASGVWGFQGQSNYDMGNAFQDHLAQYRVSRGLKTVCIDLGPIHDAGYVSENPKLKDSVQKAGFFCLGEAHLHSALEYYCDPRLPPLSPAECQPVIGMENQAQMTSRGINVMDNVFKRPLFKCMNQISASTTKTGASGPAAFDVQAALKDVKTLDEAGAVIVQGMVAKLGPIFGLEPDQVATDRPLHSYGVDSLVAIEIRNWLRKIISADVPMLEILSNRSIDDLGRLIAEKSSILAVNGVKLEE